VHTVPAGGTTIKSCVLTHHGLALYLHSACGSFVVALTAVDRIACVLATAVAKSLIDFQWKCGHEK